MLIAVVAAWVLMLGLILRHRIFVTNDSLSNYAHVWYVADQLWHAHHLALRMPLLGHGDGFAFPYGFVPWLTAAVLWPLFGDWVVTLWLVVGFVGSVAAMAWAFPELRRGWWAAILLVDPILVASPLLGQLPFLWATAFLFLAIGSWRRERHWQAALLAGVAQATHPAVVLPIAAGLVACWLPFERQRLRLRLIAWYALAVAIAAPAVWIVLVSPVVGDVSRATMIGNFAGTVGPRAVIVALPVLLVVLQRRGVPGWVPIALFELALILNAAIVPVLHTHGAWRSFGRETDTMLVPYFTSEAFQPDATYRLLRAYDGKVDLYQLIRHGGRLDAEFFPESLDRRSWPSAAAYAAFLRSRSVDHVIIFANYDAHYRTNEHALLDDLTRAPAGPPDARTCATRSLHNPDYDVYAITRAGCDEG